MFASQLWVWEPDFKQYTSPTSSAWFMFLSIWKQVVTSVSLVVDSRISVRDSEICGMPGRSCSSTTSRACLQLLNTLATHHLHTLVGSNPQRTASGVYVELTCTHPAHSQPTTSRYRLESSNTSTRYKLWLTTPTSLVFLQITQPAVQNTFDTFIMIQEVG